LGPGVSDTPPNFCVMLVLGLGPGVSVFQICLPIFVMSGLMSAAMLGTYDLCWAYGPCCALGTRCIISDIRCTWQPLGRVRAMLGPCWGMLRVMWPKNGAFIWDLYQGLKEHAVFGACRGHLRPIYTCWAYVGPCWALGTRCIRCTCQLWGHVRAMLSLG